MLCLLLSDMSKYEALFNYSSLSAFPKIQSYLAHSLVGVIPFASTSVLVFSCWRKLITPCWKILNGVVNVANILCTWHNLCWFAFVKVFVRLFSTLPTIGTSRVPHTWIHKLLWLSQKVSYQLSYNLWNSKSWNIYKLSAYLCSLVYFLDFFSSFLIFVSST